MAEMRWHIERDENGVPERMVWMGIDYAVDPPRCEHAYTTRAGHVYGCTLLRGHAGTSKGRHNYQRMT